MNGVLIETASGRIRSGLSGPPINSSECKPWEGFFIKKCGSTNVSAHDVILLKHALCLQLDQSAHLDWSSDDQRVSMSIEPGRTCIFPANKLHSTSFRHDGGHIMVFFDPQFLAASANFGGVADPIELNCRFGIDSAPLRELILLLQAESERSSSADNHAATAIARLIAIHLVQHHSRAKSSSVKSGGLSPTRLKRVLDLIEQTPLAEMSLDKMAAAGGLSVFHFARVFRQSTGMSPLQYVMTRRISRAQELLLQPFTRIQDVALECGFCDQAHLTRHFKRVTGVTPAVFVRAGGGGNILPRNSRNVLE